MPTLPRSPEDLIAQLGKGDRGRYLFFWGHQPERDGGAGRGCLSQWWPAPFAANGQTFATAEHYLMWRKAKLFRDDETAAKILGCAHPQQAKGLGRQVHGFDQVVWDAHQFDIGLAGNVAKFSQHDALCEFLVGTGERVLVEASPIDRIWGIGLAAEDPRAGDPARWRGRNLLGFVLMAARAVLRSSPAAHPPAAGAGATRAMLPLVLPVSAPESVRPPARIWTDEEWARIALGYTSQDTDDRWHAFVEADRLFLHRSWTGIGIYEARFTQRAGGWAISELLVAGDRGTYQRRGDAYEAGVVVGLIDQYLLASP
jgi:ribA/ribD-fused uncharacterized protein